MRDPCYKTAGTMNTSRWTKAGHKRARIIWFDVQGTSRISESPESNSVVARNREGWWRRLPAGGLPSCVTELAKAAGGDSCSTWWKHRPLGRTPHTGKHCAKAPESCKGKIQCHGGFVFFISELFLTQTWKVFWPLSPFPYRKYKRWLCLGGRILSFFSFFFMFFYTA